MIINWKLIPTLAALALAGCAQYATVSHRKPQFHPPVATAGSVQQGVANGLRQEKSDPLASIGEYLTVAELTAKQLAQNPNDAAAQYAYNFAVGRVIATIEHAKLDPWTQPLRIPAAGGDFTLTYKPDRRPQWNPALYDFTPADDFDVKGTYVKEHVRKQGIGAALAATGRGNNENAKRDFSSPRVFYGITAVIRFEGTTCGDRL
jgi:predicted GNAT family acetyltransferase